MKLFAIIGSTASGKSDIAHELAKKSNSCILSLDSLCIYRQLNIISAKPDRTMLDEVKYFGINLLNLDEEFNVAMFFDEFLRAKNYCEKNGKNLIICGGTSFYLKAMMDGLSPKVPQCEKYLDLDEIFCLKEKIDPAAKIAKNDKFRLQKWFDIYKFCGEIPSLWLARNKEKPLIENLLIFSLEWERAALNERIYKRSEMMLKNGAIEEVKRALEIFGQSKALGCIGAKEITQHLNGEISKSECLELISIHTRQLAKRQRTFNKQFLSTKILMPDTAAASKIARNVFC